MKALEHIEEAIQLHQGAFQIDLDKIKLRKAKALSMIEGKEHDAIKIIIECEQSGIKGEAITSLKQVTEQLLLQSQGMFNIS